MIKVNFVAEPGKQEIVVTCTLDAPCERVFKMYTDPALTAQWWGPKIYTNTIDKMEVQPGGQWRIIQRNDKGNSYAFHGVYHAVVSPERIIRTFEYEGTPSQVLLETLTLEALGKRTRLTNQSVFQSVADRDAMLAEDCESGSTESMNNLAELLAKIG
jgi:uncharacterized protein YndB with AHSA1/START domain